MAIVSAAELLQAIQSISLLDATQLSEGDVLVTRIADAKALAKDLITRGWLTPYQVNQIFQGREADLLLGQYILLERLGEGRTGQVFKARHVKMPRIVAINVIRKERLDNADAVKRFQQEVSTAATIDHSNIVHTFEADQIGDTHFLVMEFVDGTNLEELVKKKGPLPLTQACEYMLQTALGLQHAYELGMVHRDIKPSNLMLQMPEKLPQLVEQKSESRSAPRSVLPEVKIAGMGLSMLVSSIAAGNLVGIKEEPGMTGRLDFLAPEQAMAGAAVDIRADLYSLGCTFYYLLTGRVPYPDGTAGEKHHKQQFEEPVPLRELRPEVPPGLAAVIAKLMAKKPEDRYQTPADFANVLAGGVPVEVPPTVPVAPAPTAPVPETAAATLAQDAGIPLAMPVEMPPATDIPVAGPIYSTTEHHVETPASEARSSQPATQLRWLLLGGAATIVIFVAVLLIYLLRIK
jgi:serine/threonine-protein kinase